MAGEVKQTFNNTIMGVLKQVGVDVIDRTDNNSFIDKFFINNLLKRGSGVLFNSGKSKDKGRRRQNEKFFVELIDENSDEGNFDNAQIFFLYKFFNAKSLNQNIFSNIQQINGQALAKAECESISYSDINLCPKSNGKYYFPCIKDHVLYLGSYFEIKEGDLNKYRKGNEIIVSSTKLCHKTGKKHNFPKYEFGLKQEEKEISVNRLNVFDSYESLPDEVKKNAFFIGYKIIYKDNDSTGLKNLRLTDFIGNAEKNSEKNAAKRNEKIQFISLLFQKDGEIYEVRKEIEKNGKKYTVPVVASWNNSDSSYNTKALFRVAFEYQYEGYSNQEYLKNNKKIKDSKFISVTCFIGGDKYKKNITPEALKDKILYVCTDSIPTPDKRSATWADLYGNDVSIPYLSYGEKKVVEYNITFLDNKGRQFSEATASPITKYSPLFITSNNDDKPWERIDKNGNFERIDGGTGEISNCNFDLIKTEGEVTKGTELYRMYFAPGNDNHYTCRITDGQVVMISPRGEEEFPSGEYEDQNDDFDETSDDLIAVDGNIKQKAYMQESGGKDNYPKIKFDGVETTAIIFTDSEGVCTFGHGHTYGAPSKNRPHSDIWGQFINSARSNGFEYIKADKEKERVEVLQQYKGKKALIEHKDQLLLINGNDYLRNGRADRCTIEQGKPTGDINNVLMYKINEEMFCSEDTFAGTKNLQPITQNKVEKFLDDDLNVKASELFGWLKNREAVKINEGISKWVKKINRSKYPVSRGITQEQWNYLLDMFYQSVPINFRGNKFPKNFDSYKNFCDRVVEEIKNVTGPALRGAEGRKAMIKAFTVTEKKAITPEVKEFNNGDVTRIVIRAIARTKFEIETVMKEETKNNIFSQFLTDTDSSQAGTTGLAKVPECRIYTISGIETEPKNNGNGGGGGNNEQSQGTDNWAEISELISKWQTQPTFDELATEETEQRLVDVDFYHDFFSGMTPYVEIGFKESEGLVAVIDNINTPYVKSFTMEDNGVKKVNITLYDKDFGSYQYNGVKIQSWSIDSKTGEVLGNTGLIEVDEEGSQIRQSMSLEQLINTALRHGKKLGSNEKEFGEMYTSYPPEELLRKPEKESEVNPEDYLQFVDVENVTNFINLYVRFGYADKNSNTESAAAYYLEKGAYNTAMGEKRWFDADAIFGMGVYGARTETPPSDGITSNGGGGYEQENVDTQDVIKDSNVKYVKESFIVADNMTTSLSRISTYMIMGYKSIIKKNGIEYEISGIENSYVSLKRKTFLQRYAEITSYPLEVLYILMRMFNENEQGQKLDKTGVKLYLHDDLMLGDATKGFNMKFCFDTLSESQMDNVDQSIKEGKVVDYYTAQKFGITVDRRLLKKITISLGNEEAEKRNYEDCEIWKKTKDNPGLKPKPVVKDVEQLIQEFCAACPPRIEYVKNRDGGYDAGKTYPLTYFIGTYPGDNKNICIVLYYRKPKKITNIRNYKFGPQLGYKTSVIDCTIENSNEFAMLSGISGLTPGINGLMKNVRFNSEKGLGGVSDKDLDDLFNKYQNGIPVIANWASMSSLETLYDEAYASCMYKGTLKILGDPGIEFSSIMQPFTYPIHLEYLITKNESEIKKPNEMLDTPIFEQPYVSSYDAGNGYRYHTCTGYYVITKITHEIGLSGFITTLDIVRYPGIEKEVLKDIKKQLQHAPSEFPTTF